MKLRLRLKRDQRGIATLEFALIAPLVIAFLYGITQFGILFFASSGLNTAVDRAARSATVHVVRAPNQTQAQARAQMKAQIEAKLQEAQYGINAQYRGTPSVTLGQTATGVEYFDISLTYRAPINFLIYRTAPVTLSETRRVWISRT